MTGNDILKGMVRAVKARGAIAHALLDGRGAPDSYLEAEAHVRMWRRSLERFRLEAHVRFDEKQMTLADAEDLESAYETLEQLGYRNARVVETLRDVIRAGYELPYVED